MFGGELGVVYSYDITTKMLVDVWTVGAPITALDARSLEIGINIVIAATEKGTLYLRQDWDSNNLLTY